MSTTQTTNMTTQVASYINNLAKANEENKKLLRHANVTDVKQFKVKTDDNKTVKALVIYLPFPYLRDHPAAANKIVNEVQSRTNSFAFVVAKRTIVSKRSDYKQQIPKSRTLSDVCDAVLGDLVAPAQVIGRRMRVRLNGTHLYKIHLNESSREYLEDKVEVITQIYHALTNRKIAIEFRRGMNFARTPAQKRRKKVQKKTK